jgi:hypothetical protein
MDLYFGNLTSILSTLFLLAMLVFIGYTFEKHKSINKWGRKIAILALLGLVVCCLVAVRDGYYLSVQASFDNKAAAGLFTLDSIQSTVCCIGGAIIAFSSLITIFVRNQKYRKVMFCVLSATIIIKMLIIEISRILAV